MQGQRIQRAPRRQNGVGMSEPSSPAGRLAGSPDGAPSRLVPVWLENLAALSWRVLAVAGLAAVLWLLASQVSVVTASIAVAVVISAVFAPIVLRLRDRGRSRNAAAGIVWATAFVVIGGVLLVLIVAFLPYVAELVSKLRSGLEALDSEVSSLQLPPWLTDLAGSVVDASGDTGGDLVGSIVGSVATYGTILLLAAFLVFFFLRDGDKAWLWAFQSLGESQLQAITSAGDEALARVGGYLRGTTILALLTAVSNYVFILILGVPLALPLTVLSFVATYIPYFGGILATIFILLVTLGAEGSGPALLMLVLMSVRTFILGSFVRPTVYGRSVRLHPAIVLIVLPAGFQIAGLIGLFAAVPITAVVVTVAQAATQLIQPVPAPPLPMLVPAWLDRAAQWSWRLLAAIALVALLVLVLTTVPLVVVPVILALIFAATLTPVVDWLMRRGYARGRAAAVAVVGTTVAILGVLALTVDSLLQNATALGDVVVSGGASASQAGGGNLELVAQGIETGMGVLVRDLLQLGQALATLGTVVLLAVLLTFYFLRDGAGMWRRLMAHTHGPAAEELTAAFADGFAVLGGYMTGTAAISFVGAASQYVIMVILGLPLALPVFVLSFFGGFIPYIGSALTTILAFLIAVAVGDTTDIIVMFIWTIVFNLVQGNIVAPLVYGRTTHIHPAVVLVAIPAGSAVAGILGMFIVVPAIGLVAAVWRSVLHAMGSDPFATQPQPPDPTAEEPRSLDGGDLTTVD